MNNTRIDKIDSSIFAIEDNFALYLHVPFCEGKCRYCDFYSENYCLQDMNNYIDSLEKEIGIYSALLKTTDKKSRLETIYIGGGTPGLLEVSQVERILSLISASFSSPPSGEITIEANPYSLTEDKIKGYRELGVNRVSLGVQSFNDKILNFLGRKHTAEEAVETIGLIDRYFDNYNFDLIFAIPGQKVSDWQSTLQRAVNLNPEHISLYNLQIEKGTPLARAMEAGEFDMVDDSIDAEMYLLARETLRANGYQHYEISNFARPGYQSRHNRVYWQLKPYLGLGPAAHSFSGKARFNNYSNLKKYQEYLANIDIINNDTKTRKNISNMAEYIESLAIEDVIKLNKEDLMTEKMFMGLRLLEGVSLQLFYEQFDIKLENYYSREINTLKSLELLEIEDGRIRLTEKGLLHGNRVFMEFLS